MDYSANTPYLKITKEEFDEIRKSYNVNKESLNSAIDSIITWYKLQPHLPQIELDRSWIERIFIGNKRSTEKAKGTIDMTFSAKNIFPEFFTDNPKKTVESIRNNYLTVLLPNLLPDLGRIAIIKVNGKNSDTFDYMETARFGFMLNLFRSHNDYSKGVTLILDTRGLTLGHLAKYNPVTMKRQEVFYKRAFGSSIMGIHFLYPSPLLEKLVSIVKMAVSDKVKTRIHMHSDVDSLYKFVPKKVLPREYGGEEPSMEELFDQAEKVLLSDDQLKWLRQMETKTSDETKRPGKPLNEEMLGIPGSFRKLEVE